MDSVKKAFVPHFQGLSIEQMLTEFSKKYPVKDYLPDQKPILKVSRAFVMDVTR